MTKIRQAAPPSLVRQAFACRLVELRAAHGRSIGRRLSQRDFGVLLGIDAARLGTYERGEREPPLDILVAIKRVTGTSFDDLLVAA